MVNSFELVQYIFGYFCEIPHCYCRADFEVGENDQFIREKQRTLSIITIYLLCFRLGGILISLDEESLATHSV